ncbi:MFS transporter [Mrakia frigida]|uniref:MFS transporter n=1 Tax=Mrakia frigida TaxID=29902 RepID=UPI003FCC074B
MDYEKKDNNGQHLENVMSNETDLKQQHQPLGSVDDEVAKYINSGVVIGEAENKRVLRLLNRRVLPIMVITYFFQTLDKGTLAFSAVMGIRTDNNLVGQQYALLGTILYIGILIGEVPINRLIQILPISKLLSGLVTCWGILVLCHAVSKNWSGLMAVRFLLGLFESGVQPILMTLTVMYYKREEHPKIISYWFGMQAVQLGFAGVLSYGISHITSGPLKAWQVLFVIIGGMTVLWGQVIFWFLPDSPMRAKCWTEEEKTLVIERLRTNELGVQNKVFKKEQMIEAFTDPVVWLYILMQTSSFCVVNGIATFSNIIVQDGLGFSTGQTQLLNLAQAAVTLIVYLSSAWLATKYNQTILVMFLYTLPALAGTVVLMAVPVTKRNAPGMLIAFYALQFFLATGNLNWSVVSRNIAGQTKKVTVLTMMFVAYSTGCIIGPQIFQTPAAPRYISAWAAHLALYAVFAASCVLVRITLMRRNMQKRQAAHLAESGASTVEGEVVDHSNSFADLTDTLNPNFRYAF